jgi:hypothetical protein
MNFVYPISNIFLHFKKLLTDSSDFWYTDDLSLLFYWQIILWVLGRDMQGMEEGKEGGEKELWRVKVGNWMTSNTERPKDIKNRNWSMVIYSSKTRRLAVILSTFKDRAGCRNGLGLIL